MFQAEKTQQSACEKFEKISEVAKKGKQWPRRYHKQKINCFNYLQAFYMFAHTLYVVFYSFTELTEFKTRRIAYFKKNLVDLVELELKHARVRTLLNWTQKRF